MFTNYTSISSVAQPPVNNYTYQTSNTTTLTYGGAGPVNTNTTTINNTVISSGSGSFASAIPVDGGYVNHAGSDSKNHKGTHAQSDNVTVNVSNDVNNYIAGGATNGTINAPVIQNTITNNVNVNTKST